MTPLRLRGPTYQCQLMVGWKVRYKGGSGKDRVMSEWHLMAFIKIEGLRGRIDLAREVGSFSCFIWVLSVGQLTLW